MSGVIDNIELSYHAYIRRLHFMFVIFKDDQQFTFNYYIKSIAVKNSHFVCLIDNEK